MKIPNLLLVLLAMAAITAVLAAQQAPPQPLYTVDLSPLAPRGAAATPHGLAFLTDHTLAVGMCARAVVTQGGALYSVHSLGCSIETLDLVGGKARQIAQISETASYQGMLRASGSGVLLTGARKGREYGVIHLSEDLHTSQWIPKAPGTSAKGEKIPEGSGSLLDLSAFGAAFLDGNTVRIQGTDGTLLGSFAAGPPREKPRVSVHILGRGRLLFQQGGGAPEVRDSNGKVLRKLKRPDHSWWAGDMGQSEDGARVLFDRITRHVGLAQRIEEDALILPSMGMSTDGDSPNGELVSVVDTGSGKQCFEWQIKDEFIDELSRHADIDPSGRLVAIISRGTLGIYRLPDICAAK